MGVGVGVGVREAVAVAVAVGVVVGAVGLVWWVVLGLELGLMASVGVVLHPVRD